MASTAVSRLRCVIPEVEFEKLDAGVGGGEMPTDAGGRLIALALPRRDFRTQRRAIWDAPSQAVSAKHAKFDLRDVGPTPAL